MYSFLLADCFHRVFQKEFLMSHVHGVGKVAKGSSLADGSLALGQSAVKLAFGT